jgi:DNA (cytosine-5)-methyltransferase 1
MTRASTKQSKSKPVAVDLFCGAGGLTRGLLDAGIRVVAGYDTDAACRFAFEHNNAPAKFHEKSVGNLSGAHLLEHYPKGRTRILVGCAPCVTFSRYTQGLDRKRDPKWSLLKQFARLIQEVKPDIVSMENVPELQRTSVFRGFLKTLKDEGFHFSDDPDKRVVYCPEYGIPQHRSRLVIIASRLGPIELIPPTHRPDQFKRVSDALASLPPLEAGDESPDDPMHRASGLSPRNLRRIRQSTPGGTWRDWPRHLRAKCHRSKTGKTYAGVYGRMEWNRPSPTITTQFYGFGNGRFGHPEQDRGLSLREGAILQSFPKQYKFVESESAYSFKAVGRMIGNAVPVRLGEVIGKTIKLHLKEHGR